LPAIPYQDIRKWSIKMSNDTRVKVDLSFTRNLGNYESIKINIGIEDNVRQGENVDTATERVYKFVEDKLIEKTREVEEELSSRGK
jgi:hypothetical protein